MDKPAAAVGATTTTGGSAGGACDTGAFGDPAAVASSSRPDGDTGISATGDVSPSRHSSLDPVLGCQRESALGALVPQGGRRLLCLGRRRLRRRGRAWQRHIGGDVAVSPASGEVWHTAAG